MTKKVAVIIGAGPAGLTAAFELLERTDIQPLVFEKSSAMGGISKTVQYKGNRIDIGGHRFFSKSDRVMQWWLNMLPLQALSDGQKTITYQKKQHTMQTSAQGPDPDKVDQVMLVRSRKSRIYFTRKFFDYPLQLSADTLLKLGFVRTVKIGGSYMRSAVFPIKKEKNLEEFFINRFGRQLYGTFFKSYTEKVWGVACKDISAEWGAQRIKGLSITKAIMHHLKKATDKKSVADIAQKDTETTLIEQFMYPKYGPGQMWEETAKKVVAGGGIIQTNQNVQKIFVNGNRITGVQVINHETQETQIIDGDYFFSTMPVKELVNALQVQVPEDVKKISDGLMYRDFITVGLLVNKLKIKEDSATGQQLIKDNWIYIQEPDVVVGRLQIFNNWSPYLVADQSKVWIGMEYFCYDTDALWKMADDELIAFAKKELASIGIIEESEVVDATVLRVEKTYPAYFGTYDRFDILRAYLDQFENLFLIGRNGMHKYNNQDHSMLTAMVAVDNICAGRVDKTNIWAVNTEQEYHEKK